MRAAAVAAVLAGAFLLTGCQSAASSNNAGTDSGAGKSTSTPTAPPAFISGGSAEENLPFFVASVQKALAADPKIDGSGVAQAMAASPFAAKGIQYSFARTAAGLAADAMFVAVPFGGKCLIAEFGPAIDGVKAQALAPLKSGGCLIGTDVQTLR